MRCHMFYIIVERLGCVCTPSRTRLPFDHNRQPDLTIAVYDSNMMAEDLFLDEEKLDILVWENFDLHAAPLIAKADIVLSDTI